MEVGVVKGKCCSLSSHLYSHLIDAAALEDNGHTQYRSRHKKMDLTTVVTHLLVQLDCAVTTTHQCLTKDKDSR